MRLLNTLFLMPDRNGCALYFAFEIKLTVFKKAAARHKPSQHGTTRSVTALVLCAHLRSGKFRLAPLIHGRETTTIPRQPIH